MAGNFVFGCGAVGFVVVSGVLECDAAFSFEFFVVPFSDFGVREDRVVAAEEASFDTTSHTVWSWVVFSSRIAGILPVLDIMVSKLLILSTQLYDSVVRLAAFENTNSNSLSPS